MKKRKTGLIILCVFIFLALAGVYLLVTPHGSRLITRQALNTAFPSSDIRIGDVQGSLIKEISYTDLKITDSEFLPEGSIVSAQRVDFSLSAFDLEGFLVDIFNGALRMPGFDPILFSGEISNGILGMNCFTPKLNLRSVLDTFFPGHTLKQLSALIENLDIQLKGFLLKPNVIASGMITRLSYPPAVLSDCAFSADLVISDLITSPRAQGAVTVSSGLISGPHGVTIRILEDSKIMLGEREGDLRFDIRGESTVAKTAISITLTGSLGKPDLRLVSTPPRPQDMLLLMLATGKGWDRTEQAVSGGQLTPDVARDFIDYFILGGSGSELARFFGISNVSFTYEKETKGVGFSKSITEELDATYAVEQQQAAGSQQNATISQKVGAEYRITPGLSVSAEKELKPETSELSDNLEDKPNDKVLLKFKTTF